MRVYLVMMMVSGMVVMSASARVFTVKSGETVSGSVLGVAAGKVTIQADGKQISIPFKNLTEADQAYVKEWYKTRPPDRVTVRIFEKDGESPMSGRDRFPPKMDYHPDKTTSYDHKHYQIDVSNGSSRDTGPLMVRYAMFIRKADGTLSKRTGTYGLPGLKPSGRKTFTSRSNSIARTKTRTSSSYINSDGQSIYSSKTSRAKDSFGGIWVRVYSQGILVTEKKDLEPIVAKLNPAF